MDFYERGSNISLHLAEMTLLEDVSSVNYEHIQLYSHQTLGKVLILDGELQHIESWSPLYHETVVHLPCAFIEQLTNVLILGGGDFFAATEILKYSSVKKVRMIDFDQSVIELMSRHYHHVQTVLSDPRFELIIDDAFHALSENNEKFDLIINDAVDLANYSEINNSEIFRLLTTYLTPTGVCADLIYRHIFEQETTKKTINFLNNSKLNWALSLVVVPEYPGILHLLVIWGSNDHISQKLATTTNLTQQEWIKTKSCPTDIFDPRFLSYYLYLPPYLKKITSGSGDL